jgi:RNA polymerase sigma-70 factor (ECF subfamily)
MPEKPPADFAVERFRGYLLHLARQRWPRRLQAQEDPSDLVQQTLKEAHEHRDQFRGTSDAELAGWLQTMLVHNLRDHLDRIERAKRDFRRERPLQHASDDSASGPQAQLFAEQSSPSQQVMMQEQSKRLADSIARLPAAQREAVTLHHLERLSSTAVAQRMGRSEDAVAGLLRRGLKRLRELMSEQE